MKKPSLVTLSISHNIWLTRDQRYSLFEGKPCQVTGVSVPVWLSRGITSEPAKEVFCNYVLTNQIVDYIIDTQKNCYHINLPQEESNYKKPSSVGPWAEFYQSYEGEKFKPTMGAKNLLDLQDGGSKWLVFKQFNRLKNEKGVLNFIHYIEIKDIESACMSLVS